MAGWRGWEFAAALILENLYPSSLLLVAAYGLADDCVRVALGSALGRYVDRTERLRCGTRMYVLQHGLVALSCAAAAAAARAPPGTRARAALSALVLVSGASAGAGNAGSTLSVEQDWVVTLCGDDVERRAQLNSRMRAVDLCCLILAPLAASMLLTYAGLQLACLIFFLYNFAAYVPEAALLRRAQRAAAALSQPKATQSEAGSDASAVVAAAARSWLEPLRLYGRQRALAPMLALALLYCTVLSMGFLMTAYLHSQGASNVVISAFRGAGALAGLSSTLVFPALQRSLGLPACAAGALALQLACLVAGAAPCLLSEHPGSGALLVLQGGVAASRLGLWLADLAVNQLIQQSAPPAELGEVQGLQASLCSLLETLSFVAGLIWPKPSQFRLLMAGSVAAVASACLLGLRFAMQQRRGGEVADSVPLLRSDEAEAG